ncbi:MAG: carbohydrate-binding protein [Tannerella sp.]|nr:carbohydrate-binding protein [Tannerella sp.]
MYYKSLISKTVKIAGTFLALLLAGCESAEETKSEDTGIALEAITVSPASLELMTILNDTARLTAVPVPADATDVNISWISANENVATVSATGLVTARRVGQTKITAQSGRVRKDVLVTVVAADTDLRDFALDPPELTVTFGDSPVKLDITNKVTAIAVAEFLFSSSNTRVATVGADSTVTFIGVGSAEIIVIGRGDAGDVEKRVPVTVREKIPGLFGPHTLTSAGLVIPIYNFDFGGENVGYHDNDANNRTGTNYRGVNGDPDCGVDIEGSIDNPNICYTATGEWLNYTLNVRDAGTYAVSINLSSDANTGKFRLEADGVPFSGTIDVPDNNSWSNWRWWPQTAPTVYLSAGTHVIRYVAEGNDCNLKDIRFEWVE